MAKPMWIPSEEFDEVQKEVFEDGFGRQGLNCIVQGCAGCGKSCIAMNMFVNLCERGNRKPVVVTNQRALINAYLREFRELTNLKAADYVRAAHNDEPQGWFSKNTVINTFNRGIECGVFPRDATDLLVDEAQDFTLQEINQMIAYFSPNLKAVHFFGDDGQQIYEGIDDGGHRVSMAELVEVAKSVGGKDPFCRILYDNYRLPPVIAEFVDQVEPHSMLARKCHGSGTELTRLLRYDTMQEAIANVSNFIKVRRGGVKNYLVSVICQSRRQCEAIYEMLLNLKLKMEGPDVGNVRRVRGPLSDQWTTYRDPDGPKTIEDISGVNVVVSTAFASKGLQYDDVVVMTNDFNAKGWNENVLHQLHVALTRTQGGLLVCYTPNENMGQPPRPFSRVMENKFKTTL
ncbi:MAG: DUF2075 domain-containing protein [Kiritimatiellae bacterium]|nr:DUF2075 domain-containing protein [Kiritimatiellia bacterium]